MRSSFPASGGPRKTAAQQGSDHPETDAISVEEPLGICVTAESDEGYFPSSSNLRSPHWRGFNAAMAGGTMKLEGRPTITGRLAPEL